MEDIERIPVLAETQAANAAALAFFMLYTCMALVDCRLGMHA